jgi:predicted MarR family transcription regulator
MTTKTASSPSSSASANDSQRIVTSAHLVSEKSPELSEFEFGLIIATHEVH